MTKAEDWAYSIVMDSKTPTLFPKEFKRIMKKFASNPSKENLVEFKEAFILYGEALDIFMNHVAEAGELNSKGALKFARMTEQVDKINQWLKGDTPQFDGKEEFKKFLKEGEA